MLIGEWEKAISDFDKSTEMGFVTSEIYCQRGNAYLNNSELESAITDYKLCLKIDPRKSKAHYSLGMVYRILGESTLAIIEFQSYLENSPNAPDSKLVQKWIDELKTESQ